MTKKKGSPYAYLLEEYPEFVSKEQFRIIAHISKRTALEFLRSGIVPCIDSGKKTRCYKIKTTDLIAFLDKRDRYPLKYKETVHSFQKKRNKSPRFIFTDLSVQTGCTEQELKKRIEKYYVNRFEEFPDVLYIPDIVKLTGYADCTIRKWCKNGALKHWHLGQVYAVPKEWMLSLLVSEFYWNINSKSLQHYQDFKRITGCR